MEDNRNNRTGREIQDMVKDAVTTMDFKKLNNEISMSVSNALAEVRSALGIQVEGDMSRSGEPRVGTWRPADDVDERGIGQDDGQDIQGQPGQYADRSMADQSRQYNQNTGNRRFGPQQAQNIARNRQNANQSGQGISQTGQGENQTRQEANRTRQNANQSGQGANQMLQGANRMIQGGRGAQTYGSNRQQGRQTAPGSNLTGHALHTESNSSLLYNQRRSPSPQAYVAHEGQSGRQLRKGIPIPYVPRGNVVGNLATVFGTIGTVGFSITTFVFTMLTITGMQHEIFILAFGLPLIASIAMLRKGRNLLSRNRRMKIYLKQLQYRGYVSISELSQASGESERFVIRDIKKMLSLGMFPEGSLDRNEEYLIGTREHIGNAALPQRESDIRMIEDNKRLKEDQERLLRQNMELKNKYEKNIPVTEDPYANLPPEVRETITIGRQFIRQIREANEKLPEEMISNKLDRLELVIDRILYHIEKHPEKVPDMRMFMEYYLPTTLKLVVTYKDFDAQPIQGDNITTAKGEIMKTLDIINYAFEKLLDSMFEEAAMDISTDISVLETMFTQDGLTERDFEINENNV